MSQKNLNLFYVAGCLRTNSESSESAESSKTKEIYIGDRDTSSNLWSGRRDKIKMKKIKICSFDHVESLFFLHEIKKYESRQKFTSLKRNNQVRCNDFEKSIWHARKRQ